MSTAIHRLRVAAIEPLTDDAVALTFDVPAELEADFTFTAGQHVSIVGADGGRRSYSICESPAAGRLRIGVKRLPGGAFSDGVLATLRAGDSLDVLTPAGRFTVHPEPTNQNSYAVVAAGSGITPVLSMIATLLEQEPRSTLTLIYANRSQRSVMFLDEVHDLKDRFLQRLQVIHVLSRETQDLELLSGRLDFDRVQTIWRRFNDEPVTAPAAWFLCGPQALVTELRAGLADAGVPADVIHTELFHADAAPRAAVVEAPDVEGAAQVTVRLEGRSTSFDLRPDGPSVLEAALAVRPDMPFACKGGVCGTCRARVSSGSVVMDANWALEPEELDRGYVLTCQSHPTSPEVLLDYDA